MTQCVKCLPCKHKDLSLNLQRTLKRQTQRHSLGTPVLGRGKREEDYWNSPASQPSPSDPQVQWQDMSQKVKVERDSGRHPVSTSTRTYIHCMYTSTWSHVLTDMCIHTHIDLVIIECLIFAKPKAEYFSGNFSLTLHHIFQNWSPRGWYYAFDTAHRCQSLSHTSTAGPGTHTFWLITQITGKHSFSADACSESAVNPPLTTQQPAPRVFKGILYSAIPCPFSQATHWALDDSRFRVTEQLCRECDVI